MMDVSLKTLTVDPSFDIAEVEATVRRYGAAVLPGWADAAVLAPLRDEFNRVLEDRDEQYIYAINYAPGRAVSIMRDKMPGDRYPTMASVFTHPKMREVADRYMGDPCLFNYEIYATHESRPHVSVAPAHFDKLWTFKFMLYLNDIGPGNAPFGVIPGSFAVARQRFRDIFEANGLEYLYMNDERYQGMKNSDVPADFGPVVDIVGPAGTLIVFDTDTFHHAASVEPGHERMILRGHSGPSITYTKVRKGSRQWWRGERRYTEEDVLRDQLAEQSAV